MVARRRDTGEEFQLQTPWTTKGFRTVLVVLVASMHPVGREILNKLGFDIPRDPGIAMSKDLKSINSRLDELNDKIDATDVKVTSLTKRFGTFEVDFSNYKTNK